MNLVLMNKIKEKNIKISIYFKWQQITGWIISLTAEIKFTMIFVQFRCEV